MKKYLTVFIIALAVFGLTARAYCYKAEAIDISGTKYFPAVKEALSKAEKSIYLVMYFANFDPKDKKSPVNGLVEELLNAHKRKVKVKVILDQNINFPAWAKGAGEWEKEEKNDPLFVYLKKHGIEVYYDNLYTVTHSKAIVIDEELVILGSANWTESSLRRNWEASCLIRSKELAKEFLEDFSNIAVDYEASVLDEERNPPLRLKSDFLKNPSLAPRMLTAGDEIAFDLYLLLLRNFDGNPQSGMEIDYKSLSRTLGMDKRLSYVTARDELKQALRRLEERYRLIIRKKRLFQRTSVILLNYPDKAPYSLPQEKYCSIPYAYWLYGWHKILSFPEKYCYLINLLKGGATRSRLWSGYMIGLSKEFNISRNTLLRGMKGLRQLNIIEMEYSKYSLEEGVIKRGPIRFRLLGLYSPQLLDKEKAGLAKLYGNEQFKKAAGYAQIVYKGNDIQVIEDIIKKMEEYGIDEVDRAFTIVSKKSAGNPIRSYKYVVGILQTEAKE